MEIQNLSNAGDVVVVRESDPYRKGLVRLGIGTGDKHNPRHANLTAAEARAVAYALLSYAEQLPAIIDAGTIP
jgi:hypothetical protein